MANLSDALVDRINEVLGDLETIDDFEVSDTSDPDVIDITIRGRLKQDIGRDKYSQDDPTSDYDRAMKGITPWGSTGSQKKT